MGKTVRKALLMFGKPGSGKGTQKEKIEARYGLESITVGDILRGKAKTNEEIRNIMKKGTFVSDEKLADIIEEAIASFSMMEDFILDVFPRTKDQMKIYDRLRQKYQFETIALLLDISDEEAIKRLSTRYICLTCGAIYFEKGVCKCGQKLIKREDDNPETVKNRLKAYQEETQPVVDIFEKRKELIKIDGIGSFEAVTKRVFEALDDKYKIVENEHS